MAIIKIINKTDLDVSFLKNYTNKLQPFIDLVYGKKYPFKVTIIKKKNFYDRSSFDLDTHELILKIDLNKQSEEDVAWVLVHEFCHFLTANNLELKKTALSEENFLLEKILMKSFNINSDKVREIFHDFLPVEVVANFFATMIIGKFHKRHPFSNVQKFLKGKKSAKT